MKRSPPGRSYVSRSPAVAAILSATYGDFDHHNLRDDPFGELLFILCSVRTHSAGYTATFDALRRAFPLPTDLIRATVPELAQVLRGGGLAEHKAQAVRGAVDGIVARFACLSLDALQGWDDKSCEEFLTTLPFVGKKVARCVMMYALGRSVFPVDLHCWRISQRLGWIRATRPDGTCSQRDMDRLQDKIPADLRYTLHVNMVSHGRSCCTAAKPECLQCPIADLCPKIGVK